MAGYPTPKILYDPGTGPVTLTFTFPPIAKPGAEELNAVRHDSDSLSGYRQSIYVRTDTFLTLQLDFVPMADLANWGLFMAYAVKGGAFDYYPDATVGTLETFTLDDTSWKSSFAFRTMAKFSIKMRRVGASS